MRNYRLGFRVLIGVLIVTILDVLLHMISFEIRPDMMMTFPMVGEVISESFNLIFAFFIMAVIITGYQEGKPIRFLIVGAIMFYWSLLHDLFDEFFILGIPSIAVEVFSFPLGLIFLSIGLVRIVKYHRDLDRTNVELKLMYKEMSIRDNQTGLYNTRYFSEFAQTALEDSKEHKVPICLILLDVDDFKAVNDTYGHLEGDHLIAEIGSLITSEFDDTYNFRYGGEEFVILVQGMSIEACKKRAETFRQLFEGQVFEMESASYKKTISVGLAVATQEDDIRSLLDKADRAMYQAKSTGKNKVCLSPF